MYIASIGVEERFRRRSVGSQLIRFAMSHCISTFKTKCFVLEVKKSN